MGTGENKELGPPFLATFTELTLRTAPERCEQHSQHLSRRVTMAVLLPPNASGVPNETLFPQSVLMVSPSPVVPI